MAIERIQKGRMHVARAYYDFITHNLLEEMGMDVERYWADVEAYVHAMAPRNHALVKTRQRMQAQIDAWLEARADQPWDAPAYEAFLREIGYLQPDVEDFTVTSTNIDAEICATPGPQLVVPVLNPRYVLNAANARWGSLYKALYASDIIEGDVGKAYDPARGAKVAAWVRDFLDRTVPLEGGSYHDLQAWHISEGTVSFTLQDGRVCPLANPQQFAGYDDAQVLLLQNHGLHIEIHRNPDHPVAKADKAGISDVVLEAALSVIVDAEDSVAAVDLEDKLNVYNNWYQLIKGSMETRFEKQGQTQRRTLNPDRHYTAPDGTPLTLPGRAILMVRNVGSLMSSKAILWGDEQSEIPEEVLGAISTSLVAMLDLKNKSAFENSRTGSIYIIKPKIHGPEEAAFVDEMFARVERILGLAQNTIKIGLMDEERRTSLNLKAVIRAIKGRVFFINTGFLDRTGDEIRTSFKLGPFPPKALIKTMPWFEAYERRNVRTGLDVGLPGVGQIGKGMWPMPDLMAEMLRQKGADPAAGADCAWVPSPAAAVIHAMHYHLVDVHQRKRELAQQDPPPFSDLLRIPVVEPSWSAEEIQAELDNNAQSILGYVVRWIYQGLGCSKVPNIHNVGLMEDRATLRISAQHIANWLHHGVCSQEQVMATMRRMAALVDAQNEGEVTFGDLDTSLAFKAACTLVFEALEQPNGYTEPVLHRFRIEHKSRG